MTFLTQCSYSCMDPAPIQFINNCEIGYCALHQENLTVTQSLLCERALTPIVGVGIL